MKIIEAIFKTALTMLLIAFMAVIACFFIAVFEPDKVLRAIELFKNLLR